MVQTEEERLFIEPVGQAADSFSGWEHRVIREKHSSSDGPATAEDSGPKFCQTIQGETISALKCGGLNHVKCGKPIDLEVTLVRFRALQDLIVSNYGCKWEKWSIYAVSYICCGITALLNLYFIQRSWLFLCARIVVLKWFNKTHILDILQSWTKPVHVSGFYQVTDKSVPKYCLCSVFILDTQP